MSYPAVEVPKLKPTELFDKRRQRDTARLKAYNKILEQIYVRIRSASTQSSDPWVLYTVPPFILGLPRIDLEDCIVYLVHILRQQQYEVRYTYPNLLYISWKHHETDYILKNSPIMSAMLQGVPKQKQGGGGQGGGQDLKTRASEPRKSGYSGHVRFQDEITVGPGSRGGSGSYVGGSYGSGSYGSGTYGSGGYGGGSYGIGVGTNGIAPPRSALQYTPPTSFLDAIEKPSAVPRRDAMQDLMFF